MITILREGGGGGGGFLVSCSFNWSCQDFAKFHFWYPVDFVGFTKYSQIFEFCLFCPMGRRGMFCQPDCCLPKCCCRIAGFESRTLGRWVAGNSSCKDNPQSEYDTKREIACHLRERDAAKGLKALHRWSRRGKKVEEKLSHAVRNF